MTIERVVVSQAIAGQTSVDFSTRPDAALLRLVPKIGVSARLPAPSTTAASTSALSASASASLRRKQTSSSVKKPSKKPSRGASRGGGGGDAPSAADTATDRTDSSGAVSQRVGRTFAGFPLGLSLFALPVDVGGHWVHNGVACG